MPTLTDKSLGNRTEMADSDAKRLMMKRWAWPRGTRWLAGGIAVGRAGAGAGGRVGAVRARLRIGSHAMMSAQPRDRHSRRHGMSAPGRLATLGAGLLAAGALIFTALNFDLLRRNSEQADKWQPARTHDLTEQGQVTDRLTKAIDTTRLRQPRRAGSAASTHWGASPATPQKTTRP